MSNNRQYRNRRNNNNNNNNNRQAQRTAIRSAPSAQQALTQEQRDRAIMKLAQPYQMTEGNGRFIDRHVSAVLAGKIKANESEMEVADFLGLEFF